MARPPTNEWHNNLVPLNKLASLSTSQISTLDDVNEVDDQIRDLTPEIEDINVPFQEESLAIKVPPGAKFGNWVISRKSGMTGFEINNMCRAMGRFTGLRYDQIEAKRQAKLHDPSYLCCSVGSPSVVSGANIGQPEVNIAEKSQGFCEKEDGPDQADNTC